MDLTQFSLANWKDSIVQKVINILLFLDFVYINVYCFIHHLHGHGDPSHVGASTMTFAVWTVIQGFLISVLLYQFTERGKAVIVDGLSWQFPSLLVLTMAHFVVWINKLHAITFIVTIHLSILTTYIYFIVKKQYPAKNVIDEGVIHVTFSLYHAWISYILIKAAFDAFDHHNPPFGDEPRGWFVLAMIAFQALSAAYAFAAPPDVIGTLVISWVLYGIQRRQYGFYSRTGLVCMWISFVWMGKAVWGLRNRKYCEGGDDAAPEAEREPLLASA